MKKLALFLLVVVFAAACAKGNYQDVKGVMEEFLNAQENYITGLEKVENAEDYAAVTDSFAASIEVVGPKMKGMTEKYPEIFEEDNVPEALKDVDERGRALQERSMSIDQSKFAKYMSDEKVMAALQRMQSAFMSMM